MNKIPFIIISFLLLNVCKSQEKSKQLDSIYSFIELSKNSDYSIEERLKYAISSSSIATSVNNDSILLLTNRNLAFLYLNAEKYEKYVRMNRSNLNLAYKLKDTSAITVASGNLGSYYKFIRQNDSSYFFYLNSLKYLKSNEITEKRGTAFHIIAEIKEEERDFTGAEEDAIKAVRIFEQLPENEDNLYNLWSVYNLLGIISRELKNFEESIEFNDRAIDFAKQMEDGFYNEIYTINNKAYVYRQMGNYKVAVDLYNSLLPLRPKYEEYDPSFYAIIIANIADTRIESGDTNYNEIGDIFREAYKISEDLDDEYAKMSVDVVLSKFYLILEQKDLAHKHAKEAYDLGKKLSENEAVLESLLLLSKIEAGELGKAHLNEHIKLTDSLLQVERAVRNKYARIELETDQIEKENKQISKENRYLLILSGALLLLGLLTYVVITQRAKNRQLRLVQAQQEANEEIYNLMLNQQDKVEEARAQEKIRVSKELHDGVLGRLFGTRLSLDSLNFVEGKEAIQNRANYIGQLKTIEEDIRKISHEMNADFVSGSGFMDIVSELIENQTKAYGLTYNFNYTDDINWDMVTNKTKINSYRIVQESMQNIYKHAEAKHINISFLLKNNVICLYIADDGKGFDTSKGKKGIGLKNMTSRVADIDGKIEFASQVNKGTEVKVKIPYIT
ncbi:tetratricopeptide repeat-containing sensor histidine kinase [Winogradskyella immobilis]|uniref:histidine kinase n=1 Tax=Winogradskyella immobilis TaxID=2816852 RepID=A0ABS8EIN6_9FLAO|nr:tetratricopeptide repeat-containing sensor histidine kinase [Winogradskyella immobilis]MCC1483070.1 tetratricopeptide repeat protein [Winogradskyella immobilis]MCG0015165.1 tetratricopeptide repeat protein [Winogradskyella immobilis]